MKPRIDTYEDRRRESLAPEGILKAGDFFVGGKNANWRSGAMKLFLRSLRVHAVTILLGCVLLFVCGGRGADGQEGVRGELSRKIDKALSAKELAKHPSA